MKLIVGLGNPGDEYNNTRHNVGFMFVDYLYKHSDVTKPWRFDKYSHAELAEIELPARNATHSVAGGNAILAKPQTFMNKSGEAVKKIIIKNSINPADVLVVHDDLDIKLGEFKISLGKGPKLHNGTASIEDLWKTKEFWRVRIGVENRTEPISGETYVLKNFVPEEFSRLPMIFKEALEHQSFPL